MSTNSVRPNRVSCPDGGRCGHARHEVGSAAMQSCRAASLKQPDVLRDPVRKIGHSRAFVRQMPHRTYDGPCPESFEHVLNTQIETHEYAADRGRPESREYHRAVAATLSRRPSARELREEAERALSGRRCELGRSARPNSYASALNAVADAYQRFGEAEHMEPSGLSVRSPEELRALPVGTNLTVCDHDLDWNAVGAPGTVVSKDEDGFMLRMRRDDEFYESFVRWPEPGQFEETEEGFRHRSDEGSEVAFKFTKEGCDS